MQANLSAWQDLKFGVIIHWGIYATIGQAGSWSLHREHLGDFTDPPPQWSGSAAEYHTWYYDQARTFTGTDFDAAEWASACAGAGMKYVVFTTKHHDGFCMYDSAYTNLKSTAEDAGLGRDIFGEVVAAFRAAELETGVYFSKADWSRAEYWDRARPITDRFCNYPIASNPQRWRRFVDFTQDQIAELLTNYGPMSLLWLDAGWVRAPEEPIDINAIADIARKLQPGILVIDREVHGPHENYRTPEQEIPANRLDYPWETCATLTKSWCSMWPDDPTKPTSEIIDNLLAIISRGGNYLLGIGPDATGRMSVHIRQSLQEIGEWVGAHSAGIYATRAVADHPITATCLDDGAKLPVYLTGADGDLYVFVSLGDRPSGTRLHLTGLPESAPGHPLGESQLQIGPSGTHLIAGHRYAVGCVIPTALSATEQDPILPFQ